MTVNGAIFSDTDDRGRCTVVGIAGLYSLCDSTMIIRLAVTQFGNTGILVSPSRDSFHGIAVSDSDTDIRS